MIGLGLYDAGYLNGYDDGFLSGVTAAMAIFAACLFAVILIAIVAGRAGGMKPARRAAKPGKPDLRVISSKT